MARILIIEDEASLRETLASFLGREGHDVISACDGREAFDRGLSAQPDVIVADWMLQNHIHGLHVSETFQAVHPGLRTILITGFPSGDLVAESHRSGVSALLEKPFGLDDLRRAVAAASAGGPPVGRIRPIAVLEIGRDGVIHFASERATELIEDAGGAIDAARLDDLFEVEDVERLRATLPEWELMRPRGEAGVRWWVRSRRCEDERALLVVAFPEDDSAGLDDPRARILLDHWQRSKPILSDLGPVVVIEGDTAIRRLLVSQIERIGSLCYATDNLESALAMLAAEPRAEAVLVDLALARSDFFEWTRRIREICPNAQVVGTGGRSEDEAVRDGGITAVLPKPWRLSDLLDCLARGRRGPSRR